jgi:hypothetical protein
MVFTTDGKTELAKWFNAESANSPTHFAVGTNSTAPNVTDSSLGAEDFRDAFDSQSRATTLVSFEGVILTTEATGSTLTEVGIFNSSSGGVMFSRNTFAALDKTDSIELQIENRSTIV